MKNLLIICILLTLISCNKDKNEQIVSETKKIESTEHNTNTISIIKNDKGEFLVQVLVPETATHDEIYRILMDIQLEKRKDFLEDTVIYVAYSTNKFFNKGLEGTHGQFKLTNGFEDYMKILPKLETLSSEDLKIYIKYLDLVNALVTAGDNLKTAKNEAKKIILAQNKKIKKETLNKADKYLWGIITEKTEKEKIEEWKKN